MAHVDEWILLRGTSNQILLLTILLRQLTLNLGYFIFQSNNLSFTLFERLFHRLDMLSFRSELLFLPFHVILFTFGVLKIASQSPFSQTHADMRQIQEILDIRTLAGLDLEHPLDDAIELFGELGWHALERPLLDLERQAELIRGHERRTERGHLVEDDAQGPDVNLRVVVLQEYLRCDVVWLTFDQKKS